MACKVNECDDLCRTPLTVCVRERTWSAKAVNAHGRRRQTLANLGGRFAHVGPGDAVRLCIVADFAGGGEAHDLVRDGRGSTGIKLRPPPYHTCHNERVERENGTIDAVARRATSCWCRNMF